MPLSKGQTMTSQCNFEKRREEASEIKGVQNIDSNFIKVLSLCRWQIASFMSQRLIPKKIARYQNIDCKFIKLVIFWWQPPADCECVSQKLRPEKNRAKSKYWLRIHKVFDFLVAAGGRLRVRVPKVETRGWFSTQRSSVRDTLPFHLGDTDCGI